MSREQRIRDLIETFRESPEISVPKAAKKVGCALKTVYNDAKIDPTLGEIIANRPHSRTGPNRTAKILKRGVSDIPDPAISDAEAEAFETLRDIMRHGETEKIRTTAAVKLLGYCSAERKRRGRQVVVDGALTPLNLQDGRATPEISWDPQAVIDALSVPQPESE
jgi:hypothetical protein